MEIYQLINALMQYGKKNNLYEEYDYHYCVNAILSILHLDDFIKDENEYNLTIDEILDGILSYAIENNIIDNTTESKDLFDSKIMGVLTEKPSAINKKFYDLYNESPVKATSYFYKLCKDVNYIRTSRINKDIHFDYDCEYGTINISINMSKPEKDPNDIKKLLTTKQVSYPKCMLCVENVNYQGRIGFPARQNLRYIPVTLANQQYYIQYSPYSYYNEHLICFHHNHFNMKIDEQTFKELVSFVDMFPHYFIGSNADLPIVGGSILNHQHFQGGNHTLPMENAKKVLIRSINNTNVYKLHWPMSVIRLTCNDSKELLEVANKILNNWKNYDNKELSIISEDENGFHNTITPIVRKKDGLYELDLVLRNNLTSNDRPLGVFHPQEKYWHIKKENIGLIEVMGLAILPSRLKAEMEIVKKYLLNDKLTKKELEIIEKHLNWADNLKENDITINNVDDIINNNIAKVFVKVLEDCAVFKQENQDEFDKFILSI